MNETLTVYMSLEMKALIKRRDEKGRERREKITFSLNQQSMSTEVTRFFSFKININS